MNQENEEEEEEEEDTGVDDYDYCGDFYDEMNVCGKKHTFKKYVQN